MPILYRVLRQLTRWLILAVLALLAVTAVVLITGGVLWWMSGTA